MKNKFNLIVMILFLNISYNALYAQKINVKENKDFLKELLMDVKIVSLGETTHSVGSVYEEKIELIKFLHDSCGFDVLLFEAPLYDCSIVSSKIMSDSDAIMKGLYGVWGTKEILSLSHYIYHTWNSTSTPLYFGGFDCQFGAYYSNIRFGNRFYFDFMKLQDSVLSLNPQYKINKSRSLENVIRKALYYSGMSIKMPEADTMYLHDQITDILANIRDYNVEDTPYYSYWKQLLNSLLVNSRIGYQNFQLSYLRDSMMADNFEWLINNEFKGKKIIIWAATSHIKFNSYKIANFPFNEKAMGDYLKEKHGNKYYAIGFLPFEGRGGASRLLTYKIPTPTLEYLEYHINEANPDAKTLFVNLQDKYNKSIIDSLNITKARIIDNNPIPILRVIDGIYYIKSATLPKYLNKRFKYSKYK